MNRNSIGEEKQNIHQSQSCFQKNPRRHFLKNGKNQSHSYSCFQVTFRETWKLVKVALSNWFRIKLLRKHTVDQGLVSPTPLLIFAEAPEEEVVSPLYLKENHLNSRFTRSVKIPYYWNYWNDLKRGDPSHLLRFNKRSKKDKNGLKCTFCH